MRKIPAIIFTMAYSFTIYSQPDSKTAYRALDTIIYYQISSESMTISNGQVVYKVDDKSVSEETWEKTTIGNTKLKTCKPCIVKIYHAGDTLVSVGVQFENCNVGFFRSYYPDGHIKVSGQYKENNTGHWDKDILNKYCSVKDSLWTYYSESGKVIYTELYRDGKRVKH